VSYFKSSLDTKVIDALWNTYWVNTLASNPLITNANYISSQISDLGAKLEQVGNKNSTMFNERLGKATKDSQKLGCEVLHGLMGQVIKNALFSTGRNGREKSIEGSVEKFPKLSLDTSSQQQMEL
jgi:COP9 signalosome complex subunit 5